jgi:UDP-glucose 4-epimerase
MSVLELAQKISKHITFIPKREGEADTTYANVNKARSVLGWEPQQQLNDYLVSSSVNKEKHA